MRMAFILFANGITVSPEGDLRNGTQRMTKRMDESAEILVDGSSNGRNQSERHRRLIPYMTFYLPAANNDLKLPINQAYNFMPAAPPSGPVAMYPITQPAQVQQQPQAIQKLRGLIAVPVSPPMSMHHALQLQQKPIVYLATGKYPMPTRAPQVPIVQPAHVMEHQAQGLSNIKFPSYLQQQQPQSGVITQNYYQAQSHNKPLPLPQTIKQQHHNHHHHPQQQQQQTQQQTQKVNFTPFLPSNKLPGHFVPITHNNAPYKNVEHNNLVYGNNQFSSSGASYAENTANYHDQKISAGKPSIAAAVFVTSTHRPLVSPDSYQKYHGGVSKGMYQTPASVFYTTPAPNILAQDIAVYNNVKFNGNKFTKYIPKDEKNYYKFPSSPSSFKTNNFVTPTTPAPVLVTTLSAVNHKYRPLFTYPHKEDDQRSPAMPSAVLGKQPYYASPSPPTSTAAPMFVPKFIQTSSVRPVVSSTHFPSTYHPTKTYYVPSQQNFVKYVTPMRDYRYNFSTPMISSTTPRPPYKTVTITPGTNDEIDSNSLATLLRKLQETNHLPETLTPDNIDNSIRTLVKILDNLKRSKDRYKVTPSPPVVTPVADYDYKYYDEEVLDVEKPVGAAPGPNSGKPGVDYPNYSEIPETSFSCKEQRYKGFFGDPETNCQVWHYCDLNGGKASFLCPNGTIFSQVALTCDWWFNVKCANTAQQYVLNERLYKYILPFTPKFPEDYSGPLVDKYLALKFEEMEEKLRRQKQKGLHKQHENEDDENSVDENSSKDSDEDDSTEKPSITVTEAEAEEILGTKSTPPATASLIAAMASSTTTQMPPYRYITRQKVPSSVVILQPAASTSTSTTTSSPHPKTIVESERLHVIEIKTDGSTGHLVRGAHQPEGGDYASE
ncbi:uncharacterized protein LOC134833283 [Culicoides brevitarsis]|uniref:uncharacterized protein LOC134833283 n=1 Tax=Culicoides brevitarsis TaxID=469753 RepID=UPI00307BA8FD